MTNKKVINAVLKHEGWILHKCINGFTIYNPKVQSDVLFHLNNGIHRVFCSLKEFRDCLFNSTYIYDMFSSFNTCNNKWQHLTNEEIMIKCEIE